MRSMFRLYHCLTLTFSEEENALYKWEATFPAPNITTEIMPLK